MYLYISTATSYRIYNDLFGKGMIAGGYQSQKFNYNVMSGLSNFCEVISLSALPYNMTDSLKINTFDDKVEYICIENHKGFLHRYYNVKNLIAEGNKVIRKNRPEFIICDAFSLSPAIASLCLSKKFNIPCVAVVTDLHEASCDGKMGILTKIHAGLMKKFDYYVLLTEQMNDIVNPKNRPYIVMEGSCNLEDKADQISKGDKEKSVILYGGALWKENAGIEYFIEGFLKANIPNTELHFYGMGELIDYIEDISKTCPQVKYMGCVSNVELIDKQRKAALLINPRPSINEFCKYSFPSKTFEYMISGTPILMTRLPGISDEYYDYLYTIDEENADGVSEKLIEIFSKSECERQNFANSAKEFVLKNKNNVVQAKKIYDFLSKKLH